MRTLKTAELEGVALDWAVARAKGIPAEELKLPRWKGESLFRYLRDEDGQLDGRFMTGPDLLFSSKWESGGPIIDRERIDLISDPNGTAGWMGRNYVDGVEVCAYGPSALVAAMRCYVACKLGALVGVPDELLKGK